MTTSSKVVLCFYVFQKMLCVLRSCKAKLFGYLTRMRHMAASECIKLISQSEVAGALHAARVRLFVIQRANTTRTTTTSYANAAHVTPTSS